MITLSLFCSCCSASSRCRSRCALKTRKRAAEQARLSGRTSAPTPGSSAARHFYMLDIAIENEIDARLIELPLAERAEMRMCVLNAFEQKPEIETVDRALSCTYRRRACKQCIFNDDYEIAFNHYGRRYRKKKKTKVEPRADGRARGDYNLGKTCKVCGVDIWNKSISGLCRAHFQKEKSRIEWLRSGGTRQPPTINSASA